MNSVLDEVYTAGEADLIYGKPKGTTKLKCSRRQMAYRKSGGTLLVTKAECDRVYLGIVEKEVGIDDARSAISKLRKADLDLFEAIECFHLAGLLQGERKEFAEIFSKLVAATEEVMSLAKKADELGRIKKRNEYIHVGRNGEEVCVLDLVNRRDEEPIWTLKNSRQGGIVRELTNEQYIALKTTGQCEGKGWRAHKR